MKITVTRKPSAKDWTLSNFSSDDGKISGVGIEDEKRDIKVHGETRIPNGVYDMSLRISPRFSSSYYRDDEGNLILPKDRTTPELQQKYHSLHEMIWVKNVPGFEFILWHWGNSDDDSHGCYIVGSVFGVSNKQEVVLNSRKKYTEIYPIIWRAIKKGIVTVEYKEQ